ncbi:DNA-directed RNA polymerase III subunit RPC10 [Arthroderma uncinatum]|uniref:DNA-directed RNA polymerase III subunit RPC10 n=1 Tax=Arthroderma uncinatum TaxID=74035 RepID=UPI00144A7A0C|nr:DNA-directed RNA polymerase III subunit RPC10 [Arthroderma uncinatum]KAF3491722.1 DNA-directed RNA polymerase III subunit RPC10 [Arthroderma uncinatum]
MPLTFCPNCSNALTISKAPPTSRYPSGVNRFECRTCPYQYALDRTYYERTEMKRKEVADVMGGKDEWKNADNMAAQCPAEGCDGDRAFFYQLQIRSADEPMTTFLKVPFLALYIVTHADDMQCSAHHCQAVQTELLLSRMQMPPAPSPHPPGSKDTKDTTKYIIKYIKYTKYT